MVIRELDTVSWQECSSEPPTREETEEKWGAHEFAIQYFRNKYILKNGLDINEY